MKNIMISLILKYWDEVFFNDYKYKDLAFEIANLSTMLSKLKIDEPKIALCAQNSFNWIVIFLTALINDIPIVLIPRNFDKSMVDSYLTKSRANIFFTDTTRFIKPRKQLHVGAHIRMLGTRYALLPHNISVTERAKLDKKWRKLNGTTEGHISKSLFKQFKNTVDKWSDTFNVTMYSSGVNGFPRGEIVYESTILRTYKGMVRKLAKSKLRRKKVTTNMPFATFIATSVLPVIGVGGSINLHETMESQVYVINTEKIEYIWHYLSDFMGNKWPMWLERWWLTKWINTIKLKKQFRLHGLDSNTLKTIIILNDETFVRLKTNLKRIGFQIISTYGTTSTAQLISIDGQRINGVGIKIESNNPSKTAGKLFIKEKLGKLNAYSDVYTGDIATVGPNSELIVHGRAESRLITLGGHVIYPEKIEKIVNSHVLVEKSAVTERFGEIILYITFKNYILDARKITKANAYNIAKEIRSELNDNLPEEINIDREVVIFNNFELNAQGKLIRQYFNTPPNLGN